jgi:hypothetical protein
MLVVALTFPSPPRQTSRAVLILFTHQSCPLVFWGPTLNYVHSLQPQSLGAVTARPFSVSAAIGTIIGPSQPFRTNTKYPAEYHPLCHGQAS